MGEIGPRLQCGKGTVNNAENTTAHITAVHETTRLKFNTPSSKNQPRDKDQMGGTLSYICIEN
jgi:hypothetical protein